MQIYLNADAVKVLKDWIDNDEGEPNEIVLTHGEGPLGRGLYVSLAEYPEEGAALVALERGSAKEGR